MIVTNGSPFSKKVVRFRARYGPTRGLIDGLTVGGLGAIQLAKSEVGRRDLLR